MSYPPSVVIFSLLGAVTVGAQHNWVVPPAPGDLPAEIRDIEFNNGAFLITAEEALYMSRDARSGWIRHALEDLEAVAIAIDGEDIYYAVFGEKHYPGPAPAYASKLPQTYLAPIIVMRLRGESSERIFEVMVPGGMEPDIQHRMYILESGEDKYLALETGENTVSLIELNSGQSVQQQYGGALATYTFVPGGAIFLHRPVPRYNNRVDPPVMDTVLPLWYYPATLRGPGNDTSPFLHLEDAPGTFVGLAYGNGLCIGVGEEGWILRSEDLISWRFVEVQGLPPLSDVAYGDGYFVATGPTGAAFYSTDGLEWTETQIGVNDDLVAITHGNGQFVVLTEGGAMAYSLSGLWSQEPVVDAHEVHSPWLGHFWTLPGDEWILHSEHGWLFVIADNTDSVLFFDQEIGGWLWTSRDYYPFLYAFSGPNRGWLYFYRGSGRWFYAYEAAEFIHPPVN